MTLSGSGTCGKAAAPSLAARYRSFTARRAAFLLLLIAAVLASVLVNLTTGPAALPLPTLLEGIVAPDSLSTSLYIIIWEIRIPFALMALAVGACLGLAGAEMQTVLNNPLASPSTLGVMYAATLGASLAFVFHPEGSTLIPENYAVPLYAFAGAIASAALIQILSRVFGATVDTVIMFGIAMVFALQALISLVQFIATSDSLQQIVFWTMGSLARATWEKLAIVSAVLALCFLASIRQVWKMTALRGGEDYARSYGVAVDRLRLIVLFRVSAITAVAVAFTGVIGFVGLVGPHIARLALGEDHRFFIPGSMLSGAFILSGASVISKTIVPGILIPDGIVTALIGIPLFLTLLVSQKLGAR